MAEKRKAMLPQKGKRETGSRRNLRVCLRHFYRGEVYTSGEMKKEKGSRKIKLPMKADQGAQKNPTLFEKKTLPFWTA